MAPLNTNYLERIFKKLDKNGDGFVSLEELMWFLERLGFHTSQDELKLLVGKPTLDYIEFHFFWRYSNKKGENLLLPLSSSFERRYCMEKDLRKLSGCLI
ncbi:hypothetical protein Leryth_026692 [Lithospermum erythrorhizon]|nr:hypothetical protein Leryth_026692 [Lithospermum erythrorhizon]